jgi:hypothetical protein
MIDDNRFEAGQADDDDDDAGRKVTTGYVFV